MNKYFESIGKPEYKVRLNDFTGMTFYGGGSDKSQFEKSIEGRIKRWHEFLGELSAQNTSKSGTASSRSENDVLVLKPSFFGPGGRSKSCVEMVLLSKGEKAVTPNNLLQRAQQSVTTFTSAKLAPLCCASELRR